MSRIALPIPLLFISADLTSLIRRLSIASADLDEY